MRFIGTIAILTMLATLYFVSFIFTGLWEHNFKDILTGIYSVGVIFIIIFYENKEY